GHGRNRTASNSKPRHASASSRTCYEPARPDACRGLLEAFPVKNRQGICHNRQIFVDTGRDQCYTERVRRLSRISQKGVVLCSTVRSSGSTRRKGSGSLSARTGRG